MVTPISKNNGSAKSTGEKSTLVHHLTPKPRKVVEVKAKKQK